MNEDVPTVPQCPINWSTQNRPSINFADSISLKWFWLQEKHNETKLFRTSIAINCSSQQAKSGKSATHTSKI